MVLSVLTDGSGCSAANQRRAVSADRAGERADHRGALDHVQLHEQQGTRGAREVRVRSSQGGAGEYSLHDTIIGGVGEYRLHYTIIDGAGEYNCINMRGAVSPSFY